MKSPERRASAHAHGRRIAGRAQSDAIDDPYARRSKPGEPTVCPDCGAVFHAGRWQWGPAPGGAKLVLCPACQRIRDDYPAGVVTLAGGFVRQHEEEILNLIRHQEAAEKAEHPLNRIMQIENKGDGLEITTTDIHLPRRIGEALQRAYDGDLDLTFEEDRYFLRVRWSREGS